MKFFDKTKKHDYKRPRIRRREAVIAYLFILPWFIGFVLFIAGPVLASLVLSFYSWRVITPPVFTGLDNFRRMFFEDPLFIQSLKVTGIYVLFAIPLGQIGSLLLALLLNQKIRAIAVWRTIFYLPSVVSGVAVSVLWLWIYHPTYGLLNSFLASFGFQGPNWLGSDQWALPSLIIKSFWGIGGGIIIYLAGLQGVPQSLYEAAEMDGAGEVTKFFRITLPLMSPVIFFSLVLGTIGGLQTFTEAFVMTRGGPNNSTLFYGLYLYQTAFGFLNMGYASAMAWFIFVVIFLLTFLQFRFAGRWVYYEAS